MTMESVYYHGDGDHDHGDHGDHGDEESLAMSSNYPQSWSSDSLPSTTLSNLLPPSEHALHINQIYLDTKTDMLEIIEEGLQLKLEIQGIKDQFLHLIDDFSQFEEEERGDTSVVMDIPPRPGTKASAARTRVRALYEARKARIRARRSTGSIENSMAPPQKIRKVEEEEEDKENVFRRPALPRSTQGSGTHLPGATSTPMVNPAQVPMRAMTWSIRKFLTPIKEELQDQTINVNNCLPKNMLTPKNNSLFRRSSARSRDRSSKLSNIDSTVSSSSSKYSTDSSRSRVQEISRQTAKSPSSLEHRLQPVGDVAPPKPKRTMKPSPKPSTPRTPMSQASSDIVGCVGGVNVELSPMDYKDYSLAPSPVREVDSLSPTSEADLQDLSRISRLSRCDIREQPSSANISGAFHSTFNYPLHSTLCYPLHSTFSMPNDIKEDVLHKDISDTRTTVSEPIVNMSKIPSRHRRKTPVLSLPKQTLDDSQLDYQTFVSKMSSNASQPLVFSPSSYKTPSKKPQAKLCKEHGIHPTFGGPCIFQNGDTLTLNSTDEDVLDQDENGNTPKTRHYVTVAETDCDSSYLSEDQTIDHQASIDVDEYAANHRSLQQSIHHARMLKRQTGQTELYELKDPIGLSESDLHWDVTGRNASLEATRGTEPNLTGVTMLQISDLDESTLHASAIQTGSVEEDGNDTVISVDCRRRVVPGESPDSNPGVRLPQVPVNSPNITDSGGSSSRPNTDNYEYMEMLVDDTHPTGSDHISLPGSHTTQSSRSHHSHRAASSRSHYSHHSQRSSRSHPEQQYRAPIPHHPRRRSTSTPSKDSASRHSKSSKSRSSQERSSREGHTRREHSRPQSYDWDSGCSSHSSRSHPKPVTFSDNTGRRRTIIHSQNSQNLPRQRKKILAKKLKTFSDSFYRATSTGDLKIQTLGHF